MISMYTKIDRKSVRAKKHYRVRHYIFGTAHRPRLAVFRSNKHIYAQLIDDASAITLASASTLDAPFKGLSGSTKDTAKKVGQLLAERAIAKGFKLVVFDRGGLIYHGRVAALAEGAREGGLEF